MDATDLAELARHTRTSLAEQGPISEDELVAGLLEAGVADEDELDYAISEILDDYLPLAMPLPDGRWVWLPALLSGRVFTHALSAREIEHDLVDLTPDLSPIAIFVEEQDEDVADGEPFASLSDGSPCTLIFGDLDDELLDERGIAGDVVAEHGGLLLAPGTLDGLGLTPGALLGVRVTSDGLALERVAAAGPDLPQPAGLGPGLAAAFAARDQAYRDGTDRDETDDVGPQQLDLAVWAACAADADLFIQAAPPLSRSFEALGLTVDGELLAPAGFDLMAWGVRQRVGAIGNRYELDSDEALTVLAAVRMFEQVAEVYEALVDRRVEDPQARAQLLAALTPDAPPAAAVDPAAAVVPAAASPQNSVHDALALLVEPVVAAALLGEIRPADAVAAAALGMFAESLEPMAPRPSRVALRWLHGKAHEALGDLVAAEAAYRAAESLDPSWGPALVELARFASDRGDAERGLALLRRAGISDDDELVELLQRFRPPPPRALGRNAPCWCGSGRKYKQCHLHREELPLEDRAAWLYQKAGMTLIDEGNRTAVIDAALERARYDDSPLATLSALNDPLVGDAVLFEGGAFAAFLDARGSLLPADELLLGRQWTLVSRSVFDVEAVRHGQSMRLRDLRTGDVHEVREGTATRALRPGAMICARVVPAGDSLQIFGGIETVALGERDELIALLDAEPDPTELIAFLTRRRAPARLQNTEGEPLVLCEASVRVDDPEALAQAMNAEFGEPEDAGTDAAAPTWRWHELVVTHGMDRVRATFTLDGTELSVETNSIPRQDRALATIHRLAPSCVLLTDTRRPARDAAEFAAMRADFPGPADPDRPGPALLDPDDPEVAQMMDQGVRLARASRPTRARA